MKALLLSHAAEADLRSVAAYSRETWGAPQAARYLDQLRRRLALLRRHPEQGAVRDDVRPGYRTVQAGSHVIFYRVTGKHIEIVRVLHERMDVHSALTGPSIAE